MSLRSIGTHVFATTIALTSIVINANAQASGSAKASSATHVAAEMTKGKLNPAESKPGDQVALRLKDDVKSNGEVVLKKGTTINGVVKNVKRAEGKSETKGQAQSMMEIEWLVPAAQGRAAQQLSIALQSVTQVSPLYEQQNDDFGLAGNSSAAGTVAAPARSSGGSGGGLLGGALGTSGASASPIGRSHQEITTGVAAGAVGGVTSTVGSVGSVGSIGSSGSASSRSSGQSNAALLNMPSVIAVDHQTSSAIENSLGTASSGQLFKTGRGELITPGGSKQSVDIFSHLNNDTVITSQSKNFEISSGAQMQLLVGVKK